MFRRSLIAGTAAAVAMAFASSSAFAIGGASGPKVTYPKTGKLGAVIINPYEIAPLTAIVRNGGYVVTDVTVRIVPKKNGQEIKYKVSDAQVRTHGGIPVFGLYADYQNTVEVSYTKTVNGKSEKVKNEVYKIYGQPASIRHSGYAGVKSSFFTATVKKVDPKFKDRLYLVNNLVAAPANSTRVVWNNPMGGALEWNRYPMNAIIDTTGEIRWYMDPAKIYDFDNIYKAGIMMGFRQNKDGAFTWGYGQRYVKYDLMGREVWNRRLPDGYNDFSHAMDAMQNGHYLLRVASSDHLLPNGKHVRTVRDIVIEVDENGQVVDEWRLFDILDAYRDNVLKVLDQGAVCLNIDASQAGKTLSAEDLAKMDDNDHFGDIVGSGPGRNWLHVNSVDYDPTDDSIIISSRHQSAIIKIGRDKKVKWIMGSPEGWKGDFAKKVLTPEISQISVHAPLVAAKAKAGQFIILRVDADGERIPLTISSADTENGTITVIFQKVGATTMALDQLQEGDCLHDFVGPLGEPTHVEGYGRVAVLGGGLGCAIALPVAKALHEAGNQVDLIGGFKTKDIVILEEEMGQACTDLHICTDDGTYGYHGFVTGKLEELIQSGVKFDHVFAIGPLMMMKFACKLTKQYEIPTTVSMNPIMIDGTGMCGGCRLTVGGEVKFACVDGPDFDGHQVDFDEVIARNATYRDFETKAREDHLCRLGGGALNG